MHLLKTTLFFISWKECFYGWQVLFACLPQTYCAGKDDPRFLFLLSLLSVHYHTQFYEFLETRLKPSTLQTELYLKPQLLFFFNIKLISRNFHLFLRSAHCEGPKLWAYFPLCLKVRESEGVQNCWQVWLHFLTMDVITWFFWQ